MNFPTLYKQSSGGAIQQWEISTASNRMRVSHGQVGGKLQTSVEYIEEGKNIGRSNETTPAQQADAEANAKWTKKKEREGYVEELERAKAGEDDAEGGIPPMLAQTYGDANPKYRAFPAHGQRKLNGVRCIVVVKNGAVSLWSRKRKPILGVPHVQKAYEDAFKAVQGYYEIDGELYRHGWSLQKISGYVRKEKTKPGFEQISHHVYDLPTFESSGDHERLWEQRQKDIDNLFEIFIGDRPEIKKVETVVLMNEAHMKDVANGFVKDEAYEGLMYRHLKSKYEAKKRSYGLLKVKEWKEEEFPIIAVSEGRGKFAGKAIFTCRTVEGRDPGAPQEFDCCAPGNFADREEYLRRGDEMIGQQLTVKFFEWTDEKKPQFPVGMAVRDYE